MSGKSRSCESLPIPPPRGAGGRILPVPASCTRSCTTASHGERLSPPLGPLKFPASADAREGPVGSIMSKKEALQAMLTETGKLPVNGEVSTAVADMTEAIRASALDEDALAEHHASWLTPLAAPISLRRYKRRWRSPTVALAKLITS